MSDPTLPVRKHRRLPGQSDLEEDRWAGVEATQDAAFRESILETERSARRRSVDLAANLRSLRLRLDLTQQEMAERLGISLRSLQLYEKGARAVPGDLIAELYALFDIDLHQLFTAAPREPLPGWKESFADLALRVSEAVARLYPGLAEAGRRRLVARYMRHARPGEGIDFDALSMVHGALFRPEDSGDDPAD